MGTAECNFCTDMNLGVLFVGGIVRLFRDNSVSSGVIGIIHSSTGNMQCQSKCSPALDAM